MNNKNNVRVNRETGEVLADSETPDITTTLPLKLEGIVDLKIYRDPDQVLEEASRAARALVKVIEQKPKKVIIKGEQYLEFEDWQTVARFYGVTAKVRETRAIVVDDATGYEAVADAIHVSSSQIISSADAMCLDNEENWKNKPKFQLCSMAQTRACVKCLRNTFAWVVVLAGYQTSPAEEVSQDAAVPENNIKPEEKKASPSPDISLINQAADKMYKLVSAGMVQDDLYFYLFTNFLIDKFEELPVHISQRIIDELSSAVKDKTQRVALEKRVRIAVEWRDALKANGIEKDKISALVRALRELNAEGYKIFKAKIGINRLWDLTPSVFNVIPEMLQSIAVQVNKPDFIVPEILAGKEMEDEKEEDGVPF